MVGVTMVFVAGWLLAACSPIITKLQGEEELADTSATSGHNTHTSWLLQPPPDIGGGDRDENRVFILYIYLFSTFIDLALIRYNKNMLQKTDNPLNIV